MSIAVDKKGGIVASPPLEEVSSEAVQELVTQQPGALLRWGNSIFLCILLLLIAASYFIQYPDIVEGTAKLESSDASKRIIAQIGGKLSSLKTKENDVVSAGAIIGFLESTANHEEVLHLLQSIDGL